jgi:hypothetical protein
MSRTTAASRQDAQGHWRDEGVGRELYVPDLLWMMVDSRAFAYGFRCARALCQQLPDGAWLIATDIEFSALITQHLPPELLAHDEQEWRRGFIAGWVITWLEPLQQV